MKELKIRLDADGNVFRDDTLIATVKDGEIKFKHWKYKAHKDEIEMLAQDDESVVESDDPEPRYPQELISMGKHGAKFGEEHPYVVEWRKENWSKEAFNKKYAHQHDLLCNNYAAEGMKYQP